MSAPGRDAQSGEGWQFRPDVEGLRTIAIVLVVAYHSGLPYASGGFLGVDVFFVLSGFLITGILANEVRRTGRVSLARFWARRARRLLPAAALMTIATLGLTAVFRSAFDQVADGRAAIMFALYASNLYFWRTNSDYFGEETAHNPFLHTWSLSVEEQFYLVFAPLVLGVALALARRRDKSGAARALLPLLAPLTILSFLFCLWVRRTQPVLAFFTLPARAWEFGVGGVVALAADRLPSGTRRARDVASLAALAGLVGTMMLVPDGAAHPGIVTLLPVLATAALLVTGREEVPSVGARLLATAPMRYVGRLSYSWYLWHWPLLVMVGEMIAAPTILQRVAVSLLALLVSAVTYPLVEEPIRYSKYLAERSRRSLVMGAGLSIAMVAIAVIERRSAKHQEASPRLATLAAVREAILQPDRDGCHANLPSDAPRTPCAYGVLSSDTTVLLLGDSHAEQWFPALEPMVAQRGWRLVSMTKSSCPVVDVSVLLITQKRAYTECDRWRVAAMRWVAERRPTFVVLSSYHMYSVMLDGRPVPLATDSRAQDAWRDGLLRTLRAIGATGAHTLVLRDTPAPGFDVTNCLAKPRLGRVACRVTRASAVDTAVWLVERAAIARASASAAVDLANDLCPDAECPTELRGVPVYRDVHHLSAPYAESLAPLLSAAFGSTTSGRGIIPP